MGNRESVEDAARAFGDMWAASVGSRSTASVCRGCGGEEALAILSCGLCTDCAAVLGVDLDDPATLRRAFGLLRLDPAGHAVRLAAYRELIQVDWARYAKSVGGVA